MKRSTIVVISIVVLLLLLFRLFYVHFDGVKTEKLSYVHQLNYKFSTKIDSVGLLNRRNVGLIFFSNAVGTFEESVEDKLNDQLEYNGDLRFILSRSNGVYAILTSTADEFRTGDSVAVDTDYDKITCYRGGKVISQYKVTEALNGRPF